MPRSATPMAAGGRPARPGRDARGGGGHPVHGADPDPARPDAGVAVHVLSRRGRPDGRRSRGGAAHRAARALCGDAHLSNFGAFAAPDRRLVFGLNDFDETLPGPFEWDVKRLAASFAVAGRDRRFHPQARGDRPRRGAVYREAMHEFAAMRRSTSGTPASTSRSSRRVGYPWHPEGAQAGRAERRESPSKDSMRAFDRLTPMVDGRGGS